MRTLRIYTEKIETLRNKDADEQVRSASILKSADTYCAKITRSNKWESQLVYYELFLHEHTKQSRAMCM